MLRYRTITLRDERKTFRQDWKFYRISGFRVETKIQKSSAGSAGIPASREKQAGKTHCLAGQRQVLRNSRVFAARSISEGLHLTRSLAYASGYNALQSDAVQLGARHFYAFRRDRRANRRLADRRKKTGYHSVAGNGMAGPGSIADISAAV